METDKFQMWQNILNGEQLNNYTGREYRELMEMLYTMFADWEEEHKIYKMCEDIANTLLEGKRNR